MTLYPRKQPNRVLFPTAEYLEVRTTKWLETKGSKEFLLIDQSVGKSTVIRNSCKFDYPASCLFNRVNKGVRRCFLLRLKETRLLDFVYRKLHLTRRFGFFVFPNQILTHEF